MTFSTHSGLLFGAFGFDTLARIMKNQLLFVRPLLGMNLLTPLYRVHTLDAMDSPVSHRFAAANMGASKAAARLQNHLNT